MNGREGKQIRDRRRIGTDEPGRRTGVVGFARERMGGSASICLVPLLVFSPSRCDDPRCSHPQALLDGSPRSKVDTPSASCMP